MPKLQVAFNELTKIAIVQNDGTAIPADYVDAGSFDHPEPVYPGSVVLYHSVRDLLYHFNQLDMQAVTIQLADGVVAAYVTSIDIPVSSGRELRLDDPIEYGMQKINASVWPPGAANNTLTYVSSDPTVVEVSVDGTLTPKKPGKAVITITAPGSEGATKIKRELPVSVGGSPIAEPPAVPVASVTVTPTTSNRTVGQTQQLTPTVLPANATDKSVTYTSATPAVATVSATGLVTAVSAGSAVITIKTVDGDKTATHTVTVTE